VASEVKGEGQAAKLEDIVTEIETKYIVPKVKPTQRIEKASEQRRPERKTYGRDYSFDEEEEVEPQTTFTKDTYSDQPPRKNKPLKSQKGYQTIERSEDQAPVQRR
jgi:hypothetical protein